MAHEPQTDPFFEQLCEGYTPSEIAEIEQYLPEWSQSSYISVSHNILDHAEIKQITPLKLLRKAHNFQKKGSVRVPKNGYRQDNSAVYRKANEYLIFRPDQFLTEKIVTYGVNNE